MNTLTEEIMHMKERTKIDLCCYSIIIEPTGDGFYFVDSEHGDDLQKLTRHELYNYMRDNNCWNDEDRTIQYFTMNKVNYKMTWNQYEDNRWVYTGTIPTGEFDDD